jgi:hypothetical protein
MNIEHVNSDAPVRRTSRKIARGLGRLLAVLLIARSAAAQGTTADSLAERLRRAEAAIAALQVQIAEQAQSGVQARSRARMELTGRVVVTGFGNSRRVNNVDNPQFVRPDTTPGVPVRGIGMAIRQTRLGLAASVADVLGGNFNGDLDVDFYGGQQPSSGGRTFPLLRLRTARGFVRWSNAELMIGQESPLISGVNPVTPAAIGTPEFAAAGNLWLWLPQIRFGVENTGRVRFGFQGAVLAPTSGDAVAAFDTDYDLAERSQRPYLQARLRAKWGEGGGETTREVGCGIHQGWLVPAAARVDSRAVACDAVLPVSELLELRGEYFYGEGLRGLGGGGIGQNFTTLNEPLRSKGGWAQVNVRPSAVLRLGVGCGVDHPDAGAARRRNDACATYAMLRPVGPLFFGAELRRLRTGYANANARYTNDHVTLAAGFEF